MRFFYWLKGTADSVLLGFISVIVLVVSMFSYGKIKQNQGKQQAKAQAKDEDYEHAEAIRDRVDTKLDDRVRSLDEAGYRD